jgi:hypothetical protein
VTHPDPYVPPSANPDVRLLERISSLERTVRTLSSFMQGGTTARIPVVAALPAAGSQGRLLMLASDSSIWKDTGATWTLA